jgi:ABC-type glycerol-3-phosphate transport system substrate-binding protein
MKKSLFILLSLMLAFTIVLSACSTSEDTAVEETPSAEDQAALEQAEADKKAAEEAAAKAEADAAAAKAEAEKAAADKAAAEKALADAKSAEEKAAAEKALADAKAAEKAAADKAAAAKAAAEKAAANKAAAEKAAADKSAADKAAADKAAADKAAAEATKPITLNITTIPGPVELKLKDDAAAFTKKYPNVTFKFNVIESGTYENSGPRLFLSADKPDVAWYWLISKVYPAIDAGAFEPIDDLYASEQWDKALPKSTIKLFTYKDGKKYGANDTIVWAPILYYNKDILAKVGMANPKSWDDLYAAAPKIKAAGYIPLVSGVGFANIAGHVYEGLLANTLLPDQQLKMIDFSKKYPEMNYESPVFIDIFRQLKRMGEELFPAGATGMVDNDARALFVQGKAAFYSHGSWAAGEALLGKELPSTFNLGYMLYPQTRPDFDGSIGLFPGNALWVIKGTGKEAWAKKFVAYAMSKESMISLAKAKYIFPSRTDMTPEELAPLGKWQIDINKMMVQKGPVTLWHVLAPVDVNVVKNASVQAVINGSMTPEAAAKKIQEAFDKTLVK